MAASQIKTGALISYATLGTTVVLGLIYTPWMVGEIGTSDYGLYGLATSVVALFAMDFGLGTAVSRFLSMYYAKGMEEEANLFLGTVYKLYLLLAALLFVLLLVIFLLLDCIYVSLNPSELDTFKVLYMIVALYSVISTPFLSQNNILLSNEKFIFLKSCTLVSKLLITGLTVVALLMDFGVVSLVVVNAAINLAMCVVKAVYIRLIVKTKATWSKLSSRSVAEILHFTGWVTISQLASRVPYVVMPSVLGIMSGSVEIAIFSVASMLEGYVWNIADAIGGLFLPRVSKILVRDNSPKELSDLMIKVGRVQLYIVGLVICGMTLFGYEFICLWMGESFGASYPCLMMLIAIHVVSLPQQIGTIALTASDQVKYQALSNVAMAVSCLVVGAILSCCFGALGACAGILFGMIVGRVISNLYYARLLQLEISRFFVQTYSKWVPMAILLLGLAFPLKNVFGISNWLVFFVGALLFSTVYCVALWTFCLNGYERSLLTERFRI